MKNQNKFWCATSVNATNRNATSWGSCRKPCPLEKNNTLKADEVAVKSWHIQLVVGILIGIFLIVGIIISYRCIKKKKVVNAEEVTLGNAKVTNDYALNPVTNENQVMINSNMILNKQAGLLSYRIHN